MHKFREQAPKRRLNRKECKHYSSYRNNLRDDFNCRCWYCDTHDKIRQNYAIDHFVPRNPEDPIKFRNPIKDNDYYNLVYSCSLCNSAKSNIWPTNDWKEPNNWKEGFFDPVTKEYWNLFYRDLEWVITASEINSELSNYIIKTLKLWLPIHSIHWKIYKIVRLEEQIKLKLINNPNPTLKKIHDNILRQLGELTLQSIKEHE